jgi:hypothetical protein
MRMSARFFAAATLALLFTTAGAMADVRAGAPAPDFTAMDSNGKPVSLAAFNGKTVVLEWSNHDCPYVRKHYGSGNMQALQADAAAKGVVWLTVVSSAPGSQGYVSGLEANKLTDDRKARVAAVLLDPKVSLGRSYGATATPHMFVISPTGAMVYSGAIDDKPSTNAGDVQRARNYVREAIVAAAEGKTMTPSQTRAYGCSVKYGPVPRS